MTVRQGTKYAVILIAVALAVAFYFALTAEGQSIKGDGHMSLHAWAEHDRCYQHSIEAGGRVVGRIGPAAAEAYLELKWWGACDSKIESSFLNAEAGRVIQRRHGVILGAYPNDQLFVGVGLIRRAVHHFWRNMKEIRLAGFPWSDNAEVAKIICESNRKCPTMGYHEGVRPVVRYDTEAVSVRVIGPHWTWKNITLPWYRWMIGVEYHVGRWSAGVESELGGVSDDVFNWTLRRRINGSISIGAEYGTVNTPGWDKPLDRLAVSVQVAM